MDPIVEALQKDVDLLASSLDDLGTAIHLAEEARKADGKRVDESLASINKVLDLIIDENIFFRKKTSSQLEALSRIVDGGSQYD